MFILFPECGALPSIARRSSPVFEEISATVDVSSDTVVKLLQ